MKLKVEIWSDVMCPWCYIGKRRFENALGRFEHADKVQIVWKSFQLDPNLKTEPEKRVNQMLADKKGWTIERAQQANDHVTNLATELGLIYNFDKAIVANSFDAHRFTHLAKWYELSDAAEERLFQAYFTEGKNIADHSTLAQLGADIGIPAEEVEKMLGSNEFVDSVKRDAYEAQQVGARGVPFYVFNNKYAVSGAQMPEVFLEVLNKTWQELAIDIKVEKN